MSTVCKINLDATEYRRELAAVVAESREAARALATVPAESVLNGTSSGVSSPEPSGESAPLELSVTTDADQAEQAIDRIENRSIEIKAAVTADTAQAEQAIDELKNTHVEIPATVTANTDPASDAIDDLKDKPVKTEATVTADTTLAESEMNDLEKNPLKIEAKVTADTSQADAATPLSKFGTAIRGAMKENIGEQIGKGAAAIGAVGTMAGAAVPPVGALAAVINALQSSIALITAALTALIAIGMEVWDRLTVSAEEYAEKTKLVTENAQKELDKAREMDTATQGYVDRLRELVGIENAGNSTRAETAQLLQVLSTRYGNLGAEINATTGKVENLIEVEERLNAARNKEMSSKYQQVADSKMNEAKAAYMKVKGSEWFTTEGAAGKMFDIHRKNLPLEGMIQMMDQKAAASTNHSDASGYGEVAAKLREAKEAGDKAKSIRATGYESADEYNKALGKSLAAQGSAQRGRDAAQRSSRERRSDDNFADLKDIDAKKANREDRIKTEQALREGSGGLKEQLNEAKEKVAKAEKSGNDINKAKALTEQYQVETRIQESLDREYALKRQIEALDKTRTEAVRKITDQAKYELDYNKLIAAGEFEKAASLKLEKELKEQNLKLSEEEKKKILEQREALQRQDVAKQIAEAKEEVALQQLLVDGNYEAYEAEKLRLEMKRQGKTLTEEETRELLEQRKALKEQNLRKNLQEQAFGLYGQAMERAGHGQEFAEQKAMRDAEKAKGAALSEEESDMVRKLSSISYAMANTRETQLGDTSIKTNSLTARGGFAGGAKLPESDKINREIANTNKQQLEQMKQIAAICEGLGAF